MATLSPRQIYEVAIAAGFPPDHAVIFTAIALAESGGRTDARATDGEDSRGLWQINVDPEVRPNHWGDLYDPLINAEAAYDISDGGRKISPWSVTHDTYAGTNRHYTAYLDEAQEAAAAAPEGGWEGMSGAAGTPGEVAAGGLVSPIPGADLSDSFGAPRSGGRTHEGIDIFAERGTPIHAISGGTVVTGFWNKYGGTVVRIEGDDGRFYYYAHLDSVNDLEVGDRVETGAVIGTVGTTGNAKDTPPHLHLQVSEQGDRDEWINPYHFLMGLPQPTARSLVYEIDDGVPPQTADGDADGITDEFEALLGTDATEADTDDDGLTDMYEVAVSHTDPLSADTDQDGQPDAVEVEAGSDAGMAPLPEAAVAAGFGGLATRDSDADGLSDEYEIDHGLDPHSADTDADLLPDALELALGSSPLSNDSDRDGMTDSWEYELGVLEPLEQPLGPDPFDQPFAAHPAHDHGDTDDTAAGGSGDTLAVDPD